jgi:hypothetical protein
LYSWIRDSLPSRLTIDFLRGLRVAFLQYWSEEERRKNKNVNEKEMRETEKEIRKNKGKHEKEIRKNKMRETKNKNKARQKQKKVRKREEESTTERSAPKTLKGLYRWFAQLREVLDDGWSSSAHPWGSLQRAAETADARYAQR